MAEEANLARVEAMWLAWNEKRLNDVVDSIAKDAHFRHFTLGIELEGREAILNLMEHALAAVPERKSMVRHAHATDDLSSLRSTMTAHSGNPTSRLRRTSVTSSDWRTV